METIKAKYTKDDPIPEALKAFAVEANGEFTINFDDSVAAVTNPALETNKNKILGEKKIVEDKYNALVSSTGALAKEVSELRTKVATGSNITSDELAILTAVKDKLEGTPDEIKQKLDALPGLEQKVKTLEDSVLNTQIAELMKWKPGVFGDLRSHPEKGKGLSFAVEEVAEGDTTVKKAFVLVTNDSGVAEKKALEDYVKSTPSWNEYLPSLQADPAKGTGPSWVQQQSAAGGGNQTPASTVEDHVKAKNARAQAAPNPLLPNKTPVTPAS